MALASTASTDSHDFKSIRVRPLTPSDGDKMRALLLSRDGMDPERAEKRALAMDWIAFHNPFAKSEPTYFVAAHAGEIVAYLGRMPTYFVVRGKVVRAYFAHDLFAHPELRRRGLGYNVTVALYKEVEVQSSGACCMLGMTPVNLRIQKRLGYREFPVDRFAKFLNGRALSSFLPGPMMAAPLRSMLSAALRTGDAVMCRSRSGSGEISEFERFDSRFDPFIDRITHKIGICTFKTAEYLNWKYVDGPYSRRLLIAWEVGGEIRGFVVLLVIPGADVNKGFILDIMSDPDDEQAIAALCVAALQRFRRAQVDSVDCQLTDRRYIRILRRHLFLGARSRPTMTVAKLDCLDDQRDIPTRIENWHITYGDSDGFIFGP